MYLFVIHRLLFLITASFVTLLTNGQASGRGHIKGSRLQAGEGEDGSPDKFTCQSPRQSDIYDFSHKMTWLVVLCSLEFIEFFCGQHLSPVALGNCFCVVLCNRWARGDKSISGDSPSLLLWQLTKFMNYTSAVLLLFLFTWLQHPFWPQHQLGLWLFLLFFSFCAFFFVNYFPFVRLSCTCAKCQTRRVPTPVFIPIYVRTYVYLVSKKPCV